MEPQKHLYLGTAISNNCRNKTECIEMLLMLLIFKKVSLHNYAVSLKTNCKD